MAARAGHLFDHVTFILVVKLVLKQLLLGVLIA